MRFSGWGSEHRPFPVQRCRHAVLDLSIVAVRSVCRSHSLAGSEIVQFTQVAMTANLLCSQFPMTWQAALCSHNSPARRITTLELSCGVQATSRFCFQMAARSVLGLRVPIWKKMQVCVRPFFPKFAWDGSRSHMINPRLWLGVSGRTVILNIGMMCGNLVPAPGCHWIFVRHFSGCEEPLGRPVSTARIFGLFGAQEWKVVPNINFSAVVLFGFTTSCASTGCSFGSIGWQNGRAFYHAETTETTSRHAANVGSQL